MAIVEEFHIGQLKEVVKFEKNTPVSDDSGGEDENLPVWVELLTTRAKVRKQTGNRALEAAELVFNSGYTVTVRYQDAIATALSDPDSIRIVYDNKFLVITSYELQNETIRYFIFRCNEKSR